MITRYSRQKMADIWSKKARFDFMLKVEKQVALAQAEENIIPKDAATEIQKAKFDITKIAQLESETKHDVTAFILNLSQSIKQYGHFIHYGLTSSDVLDTALSLQVIEAYKILEFEKLETALHTLANTNIETICVGRTHGIHADITTFGLKIAGHLAELKRHKIRIKNAIEQFKICKLSGTVGAYTLTSNTIETKVAKKLKLFPETIATQVIPRDRHAEVILALALYQSGIERLATEFRHLQRTEVDELSEGFGKGQHGSSAMPHKQNPIGSENLCGISRLFRSYLIPAMENIILWHERDISHSSVERVIFPDAFQLLDYSINRMTDIVTNLKVNKHRMLENLEKSKKKILSSRLLLELIKQNTSRKEAYTIVQKFSLDKEQNTKLKTLNTDNLDEIKKQVRLTAKKLLEKL